MKEKDPDHFHSMYSDSDSLSDSEFGEQKVIRQADADRCSQMGRMVLVILLPIFALVVLTVVVVAQSVSVRNDAKDSQKAINNFLKVDQIVTAFGVERDTTASYLSSGGSNNDEYDRVIKARQETDAVLNRLNRWFQPGWFEDKDLSTKDKFKNYLQNYRDTVKDNAAPTVDENIEFYTAITNAMMNDAAAFIHLPEKGDIWSLVVAAGSLLRASDAIGIQRGLGASFFTQCNFSNADFVWFTNLEGQQSALRSSAFSQNPQAGETYEEKFTESPLKEAIDAQEAKMTSDTYNAECTALDIAEKYANSLKWFKDMSAYLEILVEIREDITTELNNDLNEIVSDAEEELTVYIAVLVIIVLLCLLVAVWYSKRIYNMIGDIIVHAKTSRAKSKELAFEKKKTELLLYEMLPRSIAENLKSGKEVKAEYFDNVTICYLDIVGFVALISKCTPLQVVQLLNSLYGMFDDEVDRHNVYKMEQSNDVYGVVSGVPVRNSSHAAEIANLLISLVNKIYTFRMDNMRNVVIKVRVGAHSGTCAAGVVGTKTPRYSIFGEAVKLASRMSRNGEVMRIQISDDMKKALSEFSNKYVTTERGEIEVYGKGMVKTHFLEGINGGQQVPAIEAAQSTDTHF